MDDIICESKIDDIDDRLNMLNNLHPKLEFTIEKENLGKIAFLDMTIHNNQGRLTSGWFRKETDTGLTLNYHSQAPLKYKKSVVISFVHRIYRACSNWHTFDTGMSEAIKILIDNQYPESFIYPIINATIQKLVTKNCENDDDDDVSSTNDMNLSLDSNACLDLVNEKDKFLFFLAYRGKPTDLLSKSLKRLNAPCKTIMTTRKLKTCLPSLKPLVPKMLLSNVVYKLNCPGCSASYVGQTARHLQRRVREHLGSRGTMKIHFEQCSVDPLTICEDDIVTVLDQCNSISKLLSLEALYINQIKPALNTKDEFRSRTLTLKVY